MLRISLAAFALSFMGRSLFAQAQLASCADIGCPALYNTSCPLPGLEEGLSWLGIASFKTMLSSEPLSWTVGESFRHLQRSHDNLQAELMFYLGQPPSLNLQANTSVTACALFFEGIAPRLGSNNSQGIAKNTSASDTCDDALTARCASDLRSHAQSMTGGLNGVGLSCQSLADRIRSAPPDSCRVAKGSWGTVQARNISGSEMPAPISTTNCNPTINKAYTATQVFSVNGTKSEFSQAITPILTAIMQPNGDAAFSAEVHLDCLRLIDDNSPSDTGFTGASSQIRRPTTAAALVVSALFLSQWLF